MSDNYQQDSKVIIKLVIINKKKRNRHFNRHRIKNFKITVSYSVRFISGLEWFSMKNNNYYYKNGIIIKSIKIGL